MHESVCAKLYVLFHQRSIHADEVHAQRRVDKQLLDFHGIAHNGVDGFRAARTLQLAVQQAGKVAMQAFVARDELTNIVKKTLNTREFLRAFGQ